MTKEEIVQGLYKGDSRAIKEAIKALEQQPSDDCVSRADLIDKLEILDKRYGTDFYWEVRKIVDILPPVTPTQSWIPIITREPTEEEKKDYFEQNGEELCYMIDSPMPNNGQEVLVSVGDTVGEDIFDEDFWNFEGWDIADVEAWMPLPKPYEEKRGTENGSN